MTHCRSRSPRSTSHWGFFSTINSHSNHKSNDGRTTTMMPQKTSSPLLFLFTLLILTMVFCIQPIFALDPTTPYELIMVPTFTDDLGTGTHSMAQNSPYVTYVHTVSPTALSTTATRFTFKVTPLIPIETSQQTFTFSVSSQTNQVTWAKVIYDWNTSSPDLTLQIDTSTLASTNTPVEPVDPYIFELAGRVGFVYGPNNVVTYEDRILRVMIYLQFTKTAGERSLGTYFIGPTTSSIQGQMVYTANSANTAVPSLRLGENELFQFNCQGTILSSTTPCTLGTIPTVSTDAKPVTLATQLSQVVWGADTSQISVNSGVLKIIGPLYTNGLVFVAQGATLIIDIGDSQTFTVFSTTKVPTIVNNGAIHIVSGTMRVIGTSIIGSGNVVVGVGGSLEIDSQSTSITFGLSTSTSTSSAPSNLPTVLSPTGVDFNTGNAFLPCLYSEGKVTFISGRHSFLRSIVLLATSYLRIASSAQLIFNNPKKTFPNTKYPTYVIGGLNNGNVDQSNFNAMNELSFVSGGSIILEVDTTLLFGATAKFDGLGRLTAKAGSNILVNIPFYTTTGGVNDNTSTTAGIYFNGPQTERPNSSGLLCTSCKIDITRGGIVTSSGVNTFAKTVIKISANGFLHFTGKYSSNLITGTSFTNNGDVLILNGSNVDFNIPIDSTTHIRALDSASMVYFSSKKGIYKFYRPAGTKYSPSLTSTATNAAPTGAVANNPTHLFALYCAGIVIIRDGVKVQMITDTTTASSAIQSAKFYIAGLYNSGTLYVDKGVELEVFTYTQSIEPDGLIGVTEQEFSSTPPNTTIIGLEKDKVTSNGVYTLHYSPNLVLLSASSSIKQISNSKYIFMSTQGIIYDTTTLSTSTSTLPNTALNFNIIHGHVLSDTSITQDSNGIGLIPAGFNVPLTIYPSSTLVPGLTIPFPEAILADGRPILIVESKPSDNGKQNGVTFGPDLAHSGLDLSSIGTDSTSNPRTFTLKTPAAIAQSVDLINQIKTYTPDITTCYVNTLVAVNSSAISLDIIHDPSNNNIFSDKIQLNPALFTTTTGGVQYTEGDRTLVLENLTINLFTNLYTTLQSISLTTPITISSASSGVSSGSPSSSYNNLIDEHSIDLAGVHSSTTMSLNDSNDTNNNLKMKYPYKPNGMLNQDELIDKFGRINGNGSNNGGSEQDSYFDRYFPSRGGNANDFMLGESHPNTHLSEEELKQKLQHNHNVFSQAAQQRTGSNIQNGEKSKTSSQLELIKLQKPQTTMSVHETAQANDKNAANTMGNSNNGNLPSNIELYQFKLPIFEFLSTQNLPPSYTMLLSISTINIFPIDYSSDQISAITTTATGYNVKDGNHKYTAWKNKKDAKPLSFGVDFSNRAVNLIGYTDTKASSYQLGSIAVIITAIFIAVMF